MKKIIYFIFINLFTILLVACNGSSQKESIVTEGNDGMTIQERAEKILSNTAQAFRGVDLENDEEGFSEAVTFLEAALDEAYDSYETDDQKRAFSEALRKAVESMDVEPDVRFVCAAHIRVY